MDKEFITYEQALALRELGFNEPCLGYYVGKDREVYVSNEDVIAPFTPNLDSKVMFRAPTYSQAFRWFREKLEVESFVRYKYELAVKSGYYFKIDHPKIFNFMDYDSKAYKTHPEAESACLDKLIEISK